MRDPTFEAQVDAARAYEALFVPALFAQWAPIVADAAGLVPGQRVLDVACGTGVLAREAAARTGASGYVAGLDPAPGMLAVAKASSPALDWRPGTAEAIPFDDGWFDAVVSQFGLMFMDIDRALREMLRVLRSDGRLVIAAWDSVEHLPAYAALAELLQRHAGSRAADALRAPFRLGDRAAITEALIAAGTHLLAATTHAGVARFPSIRVMVEAELKGWLPVTGVHLRAEQIDVILREAETALDAYRAADGTVVFPAPAHVVVAAKR